MLGALVSNGVLAACCPASSPSAARRSPTSSVTTVCGEIPGCAPRATYRVRSPMISLQIRNPGNSSRNAASSSFTEIGSYLTLTVTVSCRSGGARWFPAQFEEDAPAELVAVLAPPVREQGHDIKATPVFGLLVEAPHGGGAVGAVGADFDSQ